jgi:hypothetical protein
VVAKYVFCHVLDAIRQGQQRRDGVAAEEKQLGRRAAGQGKYKRLYLNSG